MPEYKKNTVNSVDELRKLIPSPPGIMAKRYLSTLDKHCIDIIQKSSVMALGSMDLGSMVGIGAIEYFDIRTNQLQIVNHKTLKIMFPIKGILATKTKTEKTCSLYFIMPGIDYTLRINGRYSFVEHESSEGILTVTIDQLFVHCARAKVRADFWKISSPDSGHLPVPGSEAVSEANPGLTNEAAGFIQQSPYFLMLTLSATGSTELSPRGDPRGTVLLIDSKTLLIPERPGNKVALSLTNIIANERIVLSFIIPGSSKVLTVSGSATLTSNPEVLQPLSIKGKAPKIGILVNIESYSLARSLALLSADLWNPKYYVKSDEVPSFSKVLAEHMNGTGLLGKATTAAVNFVVKKDLKNLY